MNTPWQMAQLGDLIRHRKEFITIDDLVTYRRPKVQLHAKGIVLRDEIPGALIKTKHQQVCRTGEFLVAEIDAKVGGFGIVPEALSGSIVSSHYFLFDVDENRLDRRYLDYFIRTAGFREQVEAQGSTNYAAIRPAHVLAYQMPLPPLPEQRRVVARIEELVGHIADARAERERARVAIEALRSSATARILAQTVDPTQTRRLSEVVELRGGGTPSKANPLYWQGIIPWISPKDMKVRELHDSIDHISEAATEETPAKLISPGAVLVVVRGMILVHTVPVAVLRVPAAINQDMKALLPKPELSPEYLCAMLWAKNGRLLEAVEKSTHDTRKLKTAKLLDTRISVPSLAVQAQTVAELVALEAKIAAIREVQTAGTIQLHALLPAILDRAFKGDLL